MGIQDRDYMRRRSDDGGESSSPADSRIEALVSGFLRRHPRFLVYVGVGLGALGLITLIVAKISGGSH
jgi:hypothetical protein